MLGAMGIRAASRAGDTGKAGRGRLHLRSPRARGGHVLKTCKDDTATLRLPGEALLSPVLPPQAPTCMFLSSWKISMVRYTMSCTVSCPMRHSVAVLTSRAACCACGPPKGPGAMPPGASGGVDMALCGSRPAEADSSDFKPAPPLPPAETQASSRKTWEPVSTRRRTRLGYTPERGKMDGRLANHRRSSGLGAVPGGWIG